MHQTSKSELYRLLPSVDELLQSADLAPLIAREGQPVVADAVRAVLARLREEVTGGRVASAETMSSVIAGLPGLLNANSASPWNSRCGR